MSAHTVAPSKPAREKKALVRRVTRDRSQRIRHLVQLVFVALNGWLGLQFYIWVRYFERGGQGFYLPRPAGAEGWLPIAGLMNTKYLFTTGQVPLVHPAAMFLFMAFALISILLKKAFCSWLCPVGTLSEYLAILGRRVFGRNLRMPRWADIPLRGLKYLLFAFFGFFIFTMSADALAEFMETPYGLLADVKMLNFFRDIGLTAAIVIGALMLGSMLVQNFWCRYLCPYGALMGLVSLLSPVKIRRDADACIDCANAQKPAPPVSPSTSSYRFALLNAPPAWSASLHALPKMRCSSLSHRENPRRFKNAGPDAHSALSPWPASSPIFSWDSCSTRAPPTTGRLSCPAPSICIWSRAPTSSRIPACNSNCPQNANET